MTMTNWARPLAIWLAAARIASAANILTNPGFESDPPGQSQNIVAWNWYGQSRGNTFNETGPVARSGSNYFKVFQGFTGAVNYSGIYQDNISGPGAIYAANGWAYTAPGDVVAGQNEVWIEVTFRDAPGNILALYRSSHVATNSIGKGTFPVGAWANLAVTNQCDPSSGTVTNMALSLVAPSGTSFVRYQIVFRGDAANSTGSVYFDDLALSRTGGGPYGNWNVVWSEEFNGPSINRSVWTHETGNNNGWGNGELEYYTSGPGNSYASNGLLHIVARRESTNGFGYTSARMKTQGLFSSGYGRYEFRAQCPGGVGLWPALWMLGTNFPGVGWPACGEIDVMEANGAKPLQTQGSIHSGSDATKIYALPGGSITYFHSYVLEWGPGALLWFVDGLLYETQTNWTSLNGPYPAPFNQPFFLVLNLAVGGNYVGNPNSTAINAGATFPAELLVDYIRIYHRTAPLALSIETTNAAVALSWPGDILARLQSTPNLATVDWSNLATNTNRLVVEPSGGAGIFRLVSP
jgi:beta-glucanase (GH16 family)